MHDGLNQSESFNNEQNRARLGAIMIANLQGVNGAQHPLQRELYKYTVAKRASRCCHQAPDDLKRAVRIIGAKRPEFRPFT
jgi:hypothetical protein